MFKGAEPSRMILRESAEKALSGIITRAEFEQLPAEQYKKGNDDEYVITWELLVNKLKSKFHTGKAVEEFFKDLRIFGYYNLADELENRYNPKNKKAN